MSVFVDTNWLEALYIEPDPGDFAAVTRAATAERRSRKQREPLTTSHLVLMEARNVFSRSRGEPHPPEWADLIADVNGRIFVDPMDWDIVRQASMRLFERFSHKAKLGTMDMMIVASAQLAGATELLSFDENLKALASIVGLRVFPPLSNVGRGTLAKLKA